MAYYLSIEPYKTDRSEFRITVNREAARKVASSLRGIAQASGDDALDDLAYTISSALERWK
jgi:hypothetical protein